MFSLAASQCEMSVLRLALLWFRYCLIYSIIFASSSIFRYEVVI